MLSLSEENYLKTIYKILESGQAAAQTNAIAVEMNTAAASATDMIKKLAEKQLVGHKPYHGVTLTIEGQMQATNIIRKHRLWEVFLVEKLGFGWDEVHEVAEQLEHIHSEKLIRKLDQYLGMPKYDPHGDPIPDANGRVTIIAQDLLLHFPINVKVEVSSVSNQSPELLQYLKSKGIKVGSKIEITERFPFDQSIEIKMKNSDPIILTAQVAATIYVKPYVK
ncbi:MAG: metal-dependent transcriptional regulator [Saprospiraceae bacterium]